MIVTRVNSVDDSYACYLSKTEVERLKAVLSTDVRSIPPSASPLTEALRQEEEQAEETPVDMGASKRFDKLESLGLARPYLRGNFVEVIDGLLSFRAGKARRLEVNSRAVEALDTALMGFKFNKGTSSEYHVLFPHGFLRQTLIDVIDVLYGEGVKE